MATTQPPTAAMTTTPTRYIYTTKDMEEFRKSQPRRDLLSFTSALGSACHTSRTTTTTSPYTYNPKEPLLHLSPAMASLHGSLRHMSEMWISEIPPDREVAARFGNPSFRKWHSRLLSRSEAIVRCVLDCHRKCMIGGVAGNTEEKDDFFPLEILQECSELGYNAASANPNPIQDTKTDTKTTSIIIELREYLHLSFGHPIRIDYGTGHEASFLVFLLALCKLGCLDARRPSSSSSSTTSQPSNSPPASSLSPVAISVVSSYLSVTRGIQIEYMLEPAGSHGVWGLDDYHCVPFYLGACQMRNAFSNPSELGPSCVHDDDLLNSEDGDRLLYLSCIRHVKNLKRGAPFFECAPMLDDISRLVSWTKVSGGLLRLFEGEVLDKMPVVQHFVFGELFKATWNPSQAPPKAPTTTFVQKADDASSSTLPPPTKAPWAK